MKKIIFLLTFILIAVFFIIAPTGTNASPMAQADPNCTPDSTGGGCPTAEPTDPPRATETAVSTNTPNPTNTSAPPAATNTPEVRNSTATPTPFPITVPTATATPFPINSGDDPLGGDPPYPTPARDLAYPTPTSTPLPYDGPTPTDLELWAMEVTQGVQNLENDMPLVADRMTVVRVYVRTDVGTTNGVRGFLALFRNGNQIGNTITAENQPISAYTDGGERVNLDDSLYFYLPESWIKEGDVTFKAFIYAGTVASVANEPNPDNNYFEVDVTINQPIHLDIIFATMHNHKYDDLLGADEPHGRDDYVIDTVRSKHYYYTGWGDSVNIANAIYRFSPASSVSAYQWEGILFPSDHDYNFGGIGHLNDWDFTSETNGWSAETAKLSDIKALVELFDPNNNLFTNLEWYGMIHPTLPICIDDSCGNWSGASNGDAAIGLMADNPYKNLEDTPWARTGGATLMHEIGHNFGLGHYDCAGNEESGGKINEDAPFTSSDCSLAPVDEDGYYGFDVYWSYFTNTTGPSVISNDPDAGQPNRGFPLQGYKAPQYVDPYSYCSMLDEIGIDCNPNQPWAGIPSNNGIAMNSKPMGVAKRGQQDNSEYIFLTGYVNIPNSDADFYSIMRMPDASDNIKAMAEELEHDVEHAIEDGRLSGYQIVFIDADGETITSQELFDRSSSHQDMEMFSFDVALVFPEETAVINIITPDGATVTSRAVSNAPTVTLITPSESVDTLPIEVRWEASDPDGDELTYTLLYSPNHGESWSVVSMDLKTTAVSLQSFDGMSGSDAGMFRVMAMDGVNTATADSEAIVTVPDGAPMLTFASPSLNRVYPLNATITFAGSASDWEDGALGDDAISWISDVDGDLGSGRSLTLNNLSAGLHEITLTAIDSAGNSATLINYIAIDPNVSVEKLSEEEMAAGTDALNGILPEADNADDVQLNATADATSTLAPATEANAEPADAPIATPEPVPAAETDSGVPPLIWVGGGLLAALLVGVFFWTRRKA